MPEVRFDIGWYQGTIGCNPTARLGWFIVDGDRTLSAEEKAEKLTARLRELGEDLEKL